MCADIRINILNIEFALSLTVHRPGSEVAQDYLAIGGFLPDGTGRGRLECHCQECGKFDDGAKHCLDKLGTERT